MLYLKSPRQTSQYEPQSDWGDFVRYVEIAKDGFAARHVDVFENGHALRYDRTEWIDAFGMIAEARFDSDSLAKMPLSNGEQIEASEFDRVWDLGSEAANQPQVYLDQGPCPIVR